MSDVAIIGYGNVGYHLAKHIAFKSHKVTIFSRTPSSEDAAQPLSELTPEAFEFILLTVPDDQVKATSDALHTSDAVVLHTSGTNPLSELSKHAKRGVVYPLQTFSRNKEVDFDALSIFVEGSATEEERIFRFVETWSNNVKLLNSSDRSKLHLAAVFACNFSNHMFHLSERFLKTIGMEFQDILPLVAETYQKAIELNPSKAQTGPAIREDMVTVDRHLQMIENEDIRSIYERITQNIIDLK